MADDSASFLDQDIGVIGDGDQDTSGIGDTSASADDKDIATIPDWKEGSGAKDLPLSGGGSEKTDYSGIISKAITAAGSIATGAVSAAAKNAGGSSPSSTTAKVPLQPTIQLPASPQSLTAASSGVPTAVLVFGGIVALGLVGGTVYLATRQPRRRSLAEGMRI